MLAHLTKTWTVFFLQTSSNKNMDCCCSFRHHPTCWLTLQKHGLLLFQTSSNMLTRIAKKWTVVVVSDIIQHAGSPYKNMDCCCFRHHPTKTWTVVVLDIIQHVGSPYKNMDCCYFRHHLDNMLTHLTKTWTVLFRYHPTKTWIFVVLDIIQCADSHNKNMDCCCSRHHPTC